MSASFFPLSDAAETSGGMYGLPSVLSPGGPVKSAIEAGMNKNTYMDKEIYTKSEEATGKKYSKISDFLGKSLLPSMTPGIPGERSPFKGGYAFERLMAGLTGKEYYGKKVSPAAGIPNLFGIKLTPVDLAMMKIGEISKVKKTGKGIKLDLKRFMSNKARSKEEREQETKISKEVLLSLVEELRGK